MRKRERRGERWKEKRSGKKQHGERSGESGVWWGKKRDTRGGGWGKTREGNYSHMLLGNNFWSLKVANMADLALLCFHFGAYSFHLSTYLCPLLDINLSLPPTFLLTLHRFLHPFFLMPLLVASSLLVVASKLSLPLPPTLPTSLHLTYFSISSPFQHISALTGCMQPRVTEGGWPGRVLVWFEPVTNLCTWALPAAPSDPGERALYLINTRLLLWPCDTVLCFTFFTLSPFFP